MTISHVYLFNVERGESELAELCDAITEQHLTDWECEWAPELLKALLRLRRTAARSHWPQNLHWDWHRKATTLQGMLARTGFSIVCDGLTQGMMIVDTVRKRCRIDGQRGMHLVYVEFLESAPWNRGKLFDPPRYRGVGSILIRAAVELSQSLEFHGRIGLHFSTAGQQILCPHLWHDRSWRGF